MDLPPLDEATARLAPLLRNDVVRIAGGAHDGREAVVLWYDEPTRLGCVEVSNVRIHYRRGELALVYRIGGV